MSNFYFKIGSDDVIHHAVNVLNEALRRDRKAVSALFLTRVECNKHLVKHKNVVTGTGKNEGTVSALGILNGMFDKAIGVTIEMKRDSKKPNLIKEFRVKDSKDPSVAG